MRHFLFLCVAVIASSIATYLITRSAEAETSTTAVVADEVSGTIRFVIDGEEIARLDNSGFVVRESVYYGGLMVDQGRDGYEREATP